MTMHDEQPAIWSASAGARVLPTPLRDVGGEQMFEERTLQLPNLPVLHVFWE